MLVFYKLRGACQLLHDLGIMKRVTYLASCTSGPAGYETMEQILKKERKAAKQALSALLIFQEVGLCEVHRTELTRMPWSLFWLLVFYTFSAATLILLIMFKAVHKLHHNVEQLNLFQSSISAETYKNFIKIHASNFSVAL